MKTTNLKNINLRFNTIELNNSYKFFLKIINGFTTAFTKVGQHEDSRILREFNIKPGFPYDSPEEARYEARKHNLYML